MKYVQQTLNIQPITVDQATSASAPSEALLIQQTTNNVRIRKNVQSLLGLHPKLLKLSACIGPGQDKADSQNLLRISALVCPGLSEPVPSKIVAISSNPVSQYGCLYILTQN